MLRSPEVMRRRLREGVEFFRFLHERKKGGASLRLRRLLSSASAGDSIRVPVNRLSRRRRARDMHSVQNPKNQNLHLAVSDGVAWARSETSCSTRA